MTTHEQHSPRIVVAYNGDATARAAVEAAAREAATTNALLDVIHVVDPGALDRAEEAHAAGRRLLDQLLTEVPTRVRFACRLVDGDPGHVIVEHAQGAQLLVVGVTTRGATKGLVMGAVTMHCVLHAPCPVLVVPSHRPAHLTDLLETWDLAASA